MPTLEKSLQKVQDVSARKGKNCIEYARALESLAEAYEEAGDHLKRVQALTEEVETWANLHPDLKSLDYSDALDRLALAYGEAGDKVRQVAILLESLSTKRTVAGEISEENAFGLEALACAYAEIKHFDKQVEALQKALSIYQAVEADTSGAICRVLLSLGEAQSALSDEATIKQTAGLAMDAIRKRKEADLVAYSLNLRQLASMFVSGKDLEKAVQLYEETVDVQKKELGNDHLEVAITLSELANACGLLGRYSDKKSYHEEALRIKRAFYGEDNCHVAVSLGNVANALGDLGDKEGRVRLLREALEIFEQEKETLKERNLTFLEDTLHNLAVAFRAVGNMEDAIMFEKRASGVSEQIEEMKSPAFTPQQIASAVKAQLSASPSPLRKICVDGVGEEIPDIPPLNMEAAGVLHSPVVNEESLSNIHARILHYIQPLPKLPPTLSRFFGFRWNHHHVAIATELLRTIESWKKNGVQPEEAVTTLQQYADRAIFAIEQRNKRRILSPRKRGDVNDAEVESSEKTQTTVDGKRTRPGAPEERSPAKRAKRDGRDVHKGAFLKSIDYCIGVISPTAGLSV